MSIGFHRTRLWSWCVTALSLLVLSIGMDINMARATMIIKPKPGVFVAVADYSFYNYKDYSHCNLKDDAHQVKKILDLSKISAQDFADIGTVKISLFMQTIGGFDETFDVIVNNHINTFTTAELSSTGWGWFNTRLAINWFDFPIEMNQLKHGLNEIIIRLNLDSEANDDRLVIGIDIFEDQGCSFRSVDGGTSWQQRPLNNSNCAGEYMVRMVLVTKDVELDNLSFSHEDFPFLPRLDMCPEVKPLLSPKEVSPQLVQTKNSDIFENGAMRVVFHHREGFFLHELVHKSMQENALKETVKENLFSLEVEGRHLTGRDFTVVRKEVLVSNPEQIAVVYDLSHDQAELTGHFRVTMDRSSELQLGFSIRNRADRNRIIKSAFPVLGGIGWSKGYIKDRYLYPYSTGIVLNHPARYISGYGGGHTYFQQMASFCPWLGGGLFLRVNDQSGEYKILHLLKADEQENDPTFTINPVKVDESNGRAPKGLIFWNPFRETLGTSMAFSYWGRDMKANERWQFATATVGIMNGDWRVAMESYKRWFEGFSHKNRYPNKLTAVFNYDSTGPEWGFRGPGDQESYNTDPTQWGHKVMEHVEDDFMTKLVGGLEHSGYWEHDEVTDEYMTEHKATAAKYGITHKLWPDRHGMLEGKHVLWGAQGDYGLRGYNERWGGLTTFRKYISELKSKGYVTTFYLNKAEAAFSSIIGRERGPEWAVMWPEGNYYWPYYDWQMCTDNPKWRDYLAAACARVIEETGGDGVRIDEMGGASRICLNPNHPHTFARWEHYNELQAQSEEARQIRQAMDNVDPTSVLLTESQGIDILGQYLDASLCYDLTEQPFTSHVAGNWEGFVGLNINRFYFPRHKVFDYQISEKHPEWRFFNATGAFNREYCYREHERQILKDNADAIGSLNPEPMLRSMVPLVYVNRFSTTNKTVYTIYNAGTSTVQKNLIAIVPIDNFHFVDLYRYSEVRTIFRDGHVIVALDLEPRAVSCIAYLPVCMELGLQYPNLKVRLRKDLVDASIKLVNQDGEILSEGQLQNGECLLPFPPDSGKTICKLYQGTYLVDAMPCSTTIPSSSKSSAVNPTLPD